MLVRHQISPTTWLEFEAANPKEAVRTLAEYGEIFAQQACGACRSESIRMEHREVDGNSYYSLRCNDCGCQLDFGQHRTGDTLFARRKDKDGNWLANNGWVKWQGNQGQGGNGGGQQNRQPQRPSVQQQRGQQAPQQPMYDNDHSIPF